MRQAEELNRNLRREAPALEAALSELGRQLVFPPDIPAQAEEAKGKRLNATIGQITDGDGKPLAPETLRHALSGLGTDGADQAIRYSSIDGIAELRDLWAARLAEDASAPFTRPQVTVGLTHGLSMVADLFAGPGRPVAVAKPFWGNYRQTFGLRRGACMLTGEAYRGGRFNPRALVEALEPLEPGHPALAIVNFPSNPGGYSPTREERQKLVDGLLEEADRRPLVVVLDDAYAGLVYEPDVPARSLFWELAGRHPNLAPIKVDGATKELSFFGGRVGFLTFALERDGKGEEALRSKLKCLLRATLGSPPAISQVALRRVLEDRATAGQMEEIQRELAERYRVLAKALSKVDRGLLVPQPFNSGCFALIELPEQLGLGSEEVRRELLDNYETGLISIAPRYLRIAFCSVAQADLARLVERLEVAVRDLAAR